MAVTAIDIVQNNFTGDSNLLCVHNPLVFIAQATYTGTAPDYIEVDLKDEDDVLLGTFKCIPYRDISATSRQFLFIADTILRGLMDSFDDFIQSGYSLEYCEGFTKIFKLQFKKYMEFTGTEFEIVALHASRQFGQDPNAESIFNNESKTYITALGKPCYLYFYNDDTANTISINAGGSDDEVLLDWDDVEFADYDDELLTAITN